MASNCGRPADRHRQCHAARQLAPVYHLASNPFAPCTDATRLTRSLADRRASRCVGHGVGCHRAASLSASAWAALHAALAEIAANQPSVGVNVS